MMTDRLNLLGLKIGEAMVHLPDQRFFREHRLVELGGIWIERVELLERLIIKSMGNFGHIFDGKTRLAKTKLNGVNREIASVLLAAEALLSRGGDEFPVNHENCGRIVTLGDAVFPRIQSRPMLMLEWSRGF